MQGFKRYQEYAHRGLQEISTLPVYMASRDIETSPMLGLKRYEHYPYIVLEEISRLPLYRA